MKDIKNILFDFGGVLFDIDIQKAINEFRNIGIMDDFTFSNPDNIIDQFETGKVDEMTFIDHLISRSELSVTAEQVYFAFDSILLGMPDEIPVYLKKLHKKYQLYLLSNTNITHYTKFHNEIINHPKTKDFYNYFTKEYYSFLLGMRKPNIEIFNYVINDSKIDPSLTLFVDDNEENLLSAEKAGFKTFWMQGKKDWKRLLKKYL